MGADQDVQLPPVRPTRAEAAAAREAHPYIDVQHPLSSCVVCGPRRTDGLHVTPGPLADEPDVLAAPFDPPSHLLEHGVVPERIVWGAVDCVSYPAHLMRADRYALLGSLSVQTVREIDGEERLVAVGWTLGSGRRIDITEQEAAAARAEALALQIFGQFSAGVELLAVELGRRLGLYETLLAAGPVTAAELADRASIAPRYEQFLGGRSVSSPSRSAAAPASALTERETEVLRLVAQGLTDAEIAAALVLSVHTVHRHIANIRTRLGVATRSAAAAWAGDQGLL